MQSRACVIGGGPAGLLAAIALRLAGAQVTLLEANSPPIDKACGEGLMPNTLAALRKLGVSLDVSSGYPLRGVCFVRGLTSAPAVFIGTQGLGVRRTILHSALVHRAESLGVELRWNVQNALAFLTSFSSHLLVAADGINSSLRRHHRFEERSTPRRYGFRRHFSISPWSSYVEIYCGHGRQIYVTPISSNEIGVALLTSDPRERLPQALPKFPELNDRLRRAKPSSTERGSVTITRQLPRVTQPGIALIGDASGSVDAISGEGIGLAAEQAVALGEAYRLGDLEVYEKSHHRISRKPRLFAAALLSVSSSEPLQTLVIRGAALFPSISNAVLAAYVGRGLSGAGNCGTTTSGSISLPNPERLKSQS